ncbi:4353_t:CDS:2 [Funneliformis geosporum]|uniref:4353_t:CDS:1 n=1 Tax=Funneliformis geosporum TaxID=1117311 RepID=A0A9W4WIE2_9GLOM|nr:4353_t:CDS:2 [Funneliformis geosporum]
MFVTATQASSILGVSSCTLRRWHRNSKITAFGSPGVMMSPIFAKQKEGLKWQQQFLLTKCPQYELISDIGSGINFKRRGLQTIQEQASRGMVAEVVDNQ